MKCQLLRSIKRPASAVTANALKDCFRLSVTAHCGGRLSNWTTICQFLPENARPLGVKATPSTPLVQAVTNVLSRSTGSGFLGNILHQHTQCR